MITIPDDDVLRAHLMQCSAWVAEQMRRTKIAETFTLTIKVEGSAENNEAKLTYVLDHRRNYECAVEGNSLLAVTFELLRRSGWKDVHQAQQLTWNGAGAPSLDEEF